MQIKEIMTATPEFINPTMTLKEAASKMDDLDTGFLPIGDPESNKLIGTVTDRDIVIRGVAKNKNIESTSIQDVMTDKILYCFENDSVEEVAENMKKLKVRRLVVLDESKNLAGIVSLGDIATHIHNDALVGDVLEAISER